MVRTPLLLASLLLMSAPLVGANPLDTAEDDPIVEVRDCHYRYQSFQVFVNGKAMTRCFVICCDEPTLAVATEASANPGPRVESCDGGDGVRAYWYPYFETTCIHGPVGGGPEVESCGRGVRVTWYPYFETTCIPQ